MLNVKDIGEQGLLRKLQAFCPTDVVGDDGAILQLKRDRKLVVTTDVLVDNVHFSDRTTSAFDVGWRGAAANLSDLAAMGATPIGITVGLSLPGETPVSWVEELYRGLDSCLRKYQSAIVGGDITRSEVITIAITALGEVSPGQEIRRSAAQVGDAIAITGYHGLSRAGLELLLHPELGQNLTPVEQKILMKAHQQPQPRLNVLSILSELGENIRVAGMDSSDGLGDAIAQICHCSEVGAVIDCNALPIHPALSNFVMPSQAEDWIFYGGEDFELVLCLPENLAISLVEQLGNGANIIGEITSEPEIVMNNPRNADLKSLSVLRAGFQHFN
ncbi:thiamine-monophosphate kinase [Xenococcus sp. PCC 7305]|uniref:thiamine-phosphate kinase n=1 Tax=Xenococcus sp. PCC 7305 TaxID=102125 RepID=UPI0002AD0530|nr:thiamine-phosphate kinase [Xenococcus sp. PCC 7305]ELS03653.1 thiamine-monophosphate kinase [Xenococcus sp. PCC 7305]